MRLSNQIVHSAVVFTGTTARDTGDYCGTTTTPQFFTPSVQSRDGVSIVKGITILDYLTTAAVDLEVWLFNETFTAPADNAAWTITDAMAENCAGVITVTASGNWKSASANQIFTSNELSIPVKPINNKLYYAVVARGTTPAWTTATPIVLNLLLEQPL
jgi:hypothetical protein